MSDQNPEDKTISSLMSEKRTFTPPPELAAGAQVSSMDQYQQMYDGSVSDSDEFWRVIKWYVRDLEKLQAICDAQANCAARYPDLLGRLRSAVESIADDPVVVTVHDTERYPEGEARVFQDLVAFLPFVFLYEQKEYPALPALIYAWADAVERRDATVFQALAESFGDGGFFSSSQGMSNAIHCADGGRAVIP